MNGQDQDSKIPERSLWHPFCNIYIYAATRVNHVKHNMIWRENKRTSSVYADEVGYFVHPREINNQFQ